MSRRNVQERDVLLPCKLRPRSSAEGKAQFRRDAGFVDGPSGIPILIQDRAYSRESNCMSQFANTVGHR